VTKSSRSMCHVSAWRLNCKRFLCSIVLYFSFNNCRGLYTFTCLARYKTPTSHRAHTIHTPLAKLYLHPQALGPLPPHPSPLTHMSSWSPWLLSSHRLPADRCCFFAIGRPDQTNLPRCLGSAMLTERRPTVVKALAERWENLRAECVNV